MADNSLKIYYKMYLEAEDVSQSRILSSESYVRNVLANHTNPYIRQAKLDNESDMDEFALRLYVDEVIEEAECSDPDQAEAFLDEFAELMSNMAHLHSFMDMEGSFAISFEGEKIAYTFQSEPGNGLCNFEEWTGNFETIKDLI